MLIKPVARFWLAAALTLCTGAHVFGQCQPCPADATDGPTSVLGLAAFRVNPDGTTGAAVGSGNVGRCDKIRLRIDLSYWPLGFSGGTTVAFSGGSILLKTADGGFFQDLTPAAGIPVIGPLGESIVATNFLVLESDFDISTHQAQIVNGRLSFSAIYGPTGTIAYFCPPVYDLISFEVPISVEVAPAPNCTVSPDSSTISRGGSITLTASPTGSGPFNFSWSGPNGFTANSQAVSLLNLQAGDAGVYVVTVTDAFGCTAISSSTLAVTPNSGAPLAVLGPSNGSFLFSITGVAGSNYRIEVSSDLINWSPLVTNSVPTSGVLTIADPISKDQPRRFYRALPYLK